MIENVILIVFGFICGGATAGLIVSQLWLSKIRQWEKDGKLEWK